MVNVQTGIAPLWAAAVVGIAIADCVGLLAATITQYPQLTTNIYVIHTGICIFTSMVKATPLTFPLLISHPLNKQLLYIVKT